MAENPKGRPLADRLSAALGRVVEALCALCIGSMTVIVILGVFFRYIINSPLNWTEETSRYLMIWGASLAISLGIRGGEHVGLTIILDSLKSQSARRAMSAAINIVVFAFLVFMFFYSLKTTSEARAQMTQALGISMLVPRLAVPIAMGLSAVQVVLTTITLFRAPARASEGPSFLDI